MDIDTEIKKAEIEDRLKHFYMKTDGTYEFPNSKEGDLLSMVHNMLTHLDRQGD